MFDVVTADVNYDQALLAELGSMATLASGRNAPAGHSFDIALSVLERGI
jgi:hypothetical protein